MAQSTPPALCKKPNMLFSVTVWDINYNYKFIIINNMLRIINNMILFVIVILFEVKIST